MNNYEDTFWMRGTGLQRREMKQMEADVKARQNRCKGKGKSM